MEIAPVSEAQQQPHQQPKPMRKKFVIVFIVLLVVLIAAGVFWFLQEGSRQNNILTATTNNTTTNTTTNADNTAQGNSTKNEVVTEPSTTTATYTNSAYKFSITYPKTYQDYGNCEDVKKVRDAIDNNQSRPKVSEVQLKLFEVSGQNVLYLAPAEVVKIKMIKNADNTYSYDYSSCKMVTTTLDLIKSWDVVNADLTKLQPTMLETPFVVGFGSASTDAQLISVLRSVFPGQGTSGCEIDKKTATTNDPNVYKVSIKDPNQTDPATFDISTSTCYIGAPYTFLYSSTHKTAVVTSAYQDLPFGLSDSFIQFTK